METAKRFSDTADNLNRKNKQLDRAYSLTCGIITFAFYSYVFWINPIFPLFFLGWVLFSLVLIMVTLPFQQRFGKEYLINNEYSHAKNLTSLVKEYADILNVPPPHLFVDKRLSPNSIACVVKVNGKHAIILNPMYFNFFTGSCYQTIIAHELAHVLHEDLKSATKRKWSSIFISFEVTMWIPLTMLVVSFFDKKQQLGWAICFSLAMSLWVLDKLLKIGDAYIGRREEYCADYRAASLVGKEQILLFYQLDIIEPLNELYLEPHAFITFQELEPEFNTWYRNLANLMNRNPYYDQRIYWLKKLPE